MGAAGLTSVGFSLFISATRLGFAAVILLPAWRGLAAATAAPGSYGYAIAAGVCLCVHFATWTTSLAFTTIAASVTLVTTNPVWVALLEWGWYGRKPTRMTATGIAIAVAGGALIAFGDAGALHGGRHPLLGDALALVGAWTVSLYFLLGREAQQRGLGTGGYVAIAYTTAAALLLPLPLLFGVGYLGYPSAVYAAILAMAAISQVFGHTSFNWSLRWLSPTLVTLAILFEPVASSVLGAIAFGEIPGPSVFVGATVLLAGVATAVWGARQPAPPPQSERG